MYKLVKRHSFERNFTETNLKTYLKLVNKEWGVHFVMVTALQSFHYFVMLTSINFIWTYLTLCWTWSRNDVITLVTLFFPLSRQQKVAQSPMGLLVRKHHLTCQRHLRRRKKSTLLRSLEPRQFKGQTRRSTMGQASRWVEESTV